MAALNARRSMQVGEALRKFGAGALAQHMSGAGETSMAGDADRDDILGEIVGGIAMARHRIRQDGLTEIEEAIVMAEAALACLEAAGFKIVRGDPKG